MPVPASRHATPTSSPRQSADIARTNSTDKVQDSASGHGAQTNSDKLTALPTSALNSSTLARSPVFSSIMDTSASIQSFLSRNEDHPHGPASDTVPRTDGISLQRMKRVQRTGNDAEMSPHRHYLSPSPSPSRAPSPLRRLQEWSLAHFRHDPFVPVDPFSSHSEICFSAFFRRRLHDLEQGAPPCGPAPDWKAIAILLTDTLPRKFYLFLFLCLPSMYFSRVACVFRDAEVSRPDIERIVRAADSSARDALPFPEDWAPPVVSPALARFRHSWEAFIDSLMREWKTLNLVSALLLSAIMSMFQVQAATDDPVIRTPALLSLICALMSLSYGCMYIVRFGTMKSMYRASDWAEDARKTKTLMWWNVWVLLAMPAVWLSWSMIAFVVCIMSFVWRTGASNSPDDPILLSPSASLGPRITISAVLVLGLVYLALIIHSLRNYGRSRPTVESRGHRQGEGGGKPAGVSTPRPAGEYSRQNSPPAQNQDGHARGRDSHCRLEATQ
ncbi:hypothetical protein FISHEDRAFT_77314 [Fistulina hepatica ATCC 64428]|uniref:Uncharacterized protein n=1 Tax=Fistulina hepatica ATCC 64428 TaxID=1128425 RepID=A0A0D7A1S0_9AGAR|nr:hypothetical protein FISHEDRAFT_77314 [Fistulina hepatica ATCC 64428]